MSPMAISVVFKLSSSEMIFEILTLQQKRPASYWANKRGCFIPQQQSAQNVER